MDVFKLFVPVSIDPAGGGGGGGHARIALLPESHPNCAFNMKSLVLCAVAGAIAASATMPKLLHPLTATTNAERAQRMRAFVDRGNPRRTALLLKKMQGWTEPPTVNAADEGRLSPIDFGADPSGRNDSTKAFSALSDALLSRGKTLPRLAANITNLGGAVIDLEGGEYLISAPITFPPYTGNAQIVRGSLLASKSFPSDRYMVEIGASSCSNQQRSCNMNIQVSGVLFDGGQVAAGGVWVGATMGTALGPMNYYTGHT